MKKDHPLQAGLRFCHAMAESNPEWSAERIDWLECAHRTFMELEKKRKRGRPSKREGLDSDSQALTFMGFQRRKTGETCMRALARMAVDQGLVPKKGSLESRVDRLARKFGDRFRKHVKQPKLTTTAQKQRWVCLYRALARHDLSWAEREKLDAEMETLMRKMLGEKAYQGYQREETYLKRRDQFRS
jgi:hypothetical protein